VPYRLIRRGQRKHRMEELRHREMLTMMHQTGQQGPPRLPRLPTLFRHANLGSTSLEDRYGHSYRHLRASDHAHLRGFGPLLTVAARWSSSHVAHP
jgi:hypothetical protein